MGGLNNPIWYSVQCPLASVHWPPLITWHHTRDIWTLLPYQKKSVLNFSRHIYVAILQIWIYRSVQSCRCSGRQCRRRERVCFNFERPLIVYPCSIIGSWRLLATISTVVTFWRCMASRLTALCRLIFHTSRPILVLQYRCTASVTSCSTGTLKCVYWMHLLDAF